MTSKQSQYERHSADSQREPSLDYTGRQPWEPSPMEWYSGEGFGYKQKVDAFINGIIETSGPADLSHTARQAVTINFLGTQARLMQHNFEAYHDLLQRHDVTDERMSTLLELARGGTATQAELIELIKDTPLVSIELAKLTHPYGVRSEYLGPMEDLVFEAIDNNEGYLYLETELPEPRLKVNHHQRHNDHLIATTKQVIGEVGDVHIAKRTASLVLVDESHGFDSTVADRMKRTFDGEADHQWHNRVFKQSGLQDYLQSVDTKNQPEWLLPISTVYYAYRDGRRKSDKPEKRGSGSAFLTDLVKSELTKATGLIKKW